MDVFTGQTEIDPYRTDSRVARMRFDVAYAGSWLLMGLTIARDELARAFEPRRVTR